MPNKKEFKCKKTVDNPDKSGYCIPMTLTDLSSFDLAEFDAAVVAQQAADLDFQIKENEENV